MTALGAAAAVVLAGCLWRTAPWRWPWRIADVGPVRTRGPRSPAAPRRGVTRTAPDRPGRPRRDPADRRPRSGGASDLVACADLLVVAASAGHSLHTALGAVGAVGAGPVSQGLARVAEEVRRGRRVTDALEAMAQRLGPGVRPLATTLLVAASAGTPLAPALQRLADGERRRRRRQVEERVRRLPVLLLFPLVGMILPAFALLTVVPVGLATLRSDAFEAAVGPRAAPPLPPVPSNPSSPEPPP